MAADFSIKKGNTREAIQVTLKRNGDAIDLSGSGVSVKFQMRKISSGTLKVDAEATIVDDVGGEVKYEWKDADVNTTGIYYCEFIVTYGDGTVETFPSRGYKTIKIGEDLK